MKEQEERRVFSLINSPAGDFGEMPYFSDKNVGRKTSDGVKFRQAVEGGLDHLFAVIDDVVDLIDVDIVIDLDIDDLHVLDVYYCGLDHVIVAAVDVYVV